MNGEWGTAAPAGRGGEVTGQVVVGVSDSLGGLAALRAAAEEARRSGRVLVAVAAWEPPEGEGLYARRPDPEWARHWYGEARAALDRAFDEALGGPPTDMDVLRRVVRARPGRALCETVTGPDDLLVIGAHPRRLWRGRTHRYVAAHATCPLLTVPAPPGPSRHELRALRRARAGDFVTAGPSAAG
ncbi:universal stress protein [Streptomyces antnestii]|uniref:universal stress protein n=1 Tax=Streptomyces antnestii TaxID=2494256 RepID=UPI001CB98155|nr:universal stress protein [Streptomyces sp. San01]